MNDVVFLTRDLKDTVNQMLQGIHFLWPYCRQSILQTFSGNGKKFVTSRVRYIERLLGKLWKIIDSSCIVCVSCMGTSKGKQDSFQGVHQIP